MSEVYQYHKALKLKWQERKSKDKGLTLQFLAEKLKIQHTFLSRFFNHGGVHLNDDALYSLSLILDLTPNELDEIFLLKAYERAGHKALKEHLWLKIEKIKRDKNLNVEELSTDHRLALETKYLMDPHAALMHVAFHVKAHRDDPHELMNIFGLKHEHFMELLELLSELDFIEYTRRPLKVLRVKKSRVHFPPHSKIVRAHQNLLRTLSQSKLQKISEAKKTSFNATFAASDAAMIKIKDAFNEFISKAQKLSIESSAEKVYQLNFDLFSWTD